MLTAATVALAGAITLGVLAFFTRHNRSEPIEPAHETFGRPKEPTYEDTEAALFETLQAAEYRIPYEPPASWPLLECDHEWEEVHVMSQAEPVAAWCVICGSPGVHTHLRDGVPVDQYGEVYP